MRLIVTNPLNLLALIAIVTVLILTSLQSPVISVSIVILLAFSIVAVRDPKTALLILFGTKPIIDATWAFRIPGIGLNMLQIMGVAFPIFVIAVLYSYRANLGRVRHFRLFIAFFFLNLLSMVLTVAVSPDSFFNTVVVFFQSLNSLAAYVIVPILFTKNEDRRKLFLVWILAGIFPLVTAYSQIFGLIQGRTTRTTGELVRIAGLYYDSTNLRMYSMQMLFVVYVYLGDYAATLKKGSRPLWFLWMPLMPLSFYVVYRGYSKAAMGIVVACFIIYSVLRRRVILGALTVLSATMFYLMSETVEAEISALLRKEITYVEGTMNPEHEYTLLGGRFVRWEISMDKFSEADIVDQLVGVDYATGIFIHSDFLRILVGTGYFGLITYCLLLLFLFRSLWKAFVQYNDSLSVAGFFAYASLIIDSIGLVPLLYPGYSWFCFGLISLSINREEKATSDA